MNAASRAVSMPARGRANLLVCGIGDCAGLEAGRAPLPGREGEFGETSDADKAAAVAKAK